MMAIKKAARAKPVPPIMVHKGGSPKLTIMVHKGRKPKIDHYTTKIETILKTTK